MGQKGFWDEQERREKLHQKKPMLKWLNEQSTGKISAPYEKPTSAESCNKTLRFQAGDGPLVDTIELPPDYNLYISQLIY